jgi:hypothetical protein
LILFKIIFHIFFIRASLDVEEQLQGMVDAECCKKKKKKLIDLKFGTKTFLGATKKGMSMCGGVVVLLQCMQIPTTTTADGYI